MVLPPSFAERPSKPTISLVWQLELCNVVRYDPEQVDFQNAAGILASQFDYNGLSNSMNVQQAPPLDATLGSGSGNRRSNYSPDFLLSSRSQLGLDIPVQSLSITRLPPLRLKVARSSSLLPRTDITPPQDPLHSTAYSSGGMPMDAGHPSSSSSAQAPQGSTTGNNASSTQEPRKGGSGTVIACR